MLELQLRHGGLFFCQQRGVPFSFHLLLWKISRLPFFRSNGHEPIVAAPPLECPGAPWSARRLKIHFQTFYFILSRLGLVCENIEYLWIFSDFHLAQEFNHEYIRWGGRLHIAMILSDASSLKIWWRISFIYTQEIIWKERSEKAFNSPFYRINSGLDFRPLCQDSRRNHHRGLWKRSRMKRQSNEPVWHHTSCWNICIMLCISISSWTFIWR